MSVARTPPSGATPARKRAGNPGQAKSGTPRSSPANEQVSVRRFDADHRDTTLTFAQALATKPADRQLLWIDISGPLDPGRAADLAKRFGLDERTRRSLEQPGDRPHLAIHGTYFHARVIAEPQDRASDRAWLDVIAGQANAVISQHARPIRFLEQVDARVESDASVGSISSASFVALLLDGAVTSYFEAADAIEDDVDELDARSLQRNAGTELLDDLVALRRRIARLRRLLAAHREVFAALSDAGMRQVLEDEEAAAGLLAVSERFGDALSAVEDGREVLLGSFDVYMTRTAQRTNDIMKILAVTTVLLLPGSLIAGLLGMNVSIPLSKDDPASFWLVVVSVVALAALIVGFARFRRWL